MIGRPLGGSHCPHINGGSSDKSVILSFIEDTMLRLLCVGRQYKENSPLAVEQAVTTHRQIEVCGGV